MHDRLLMEDEEMKSGLDSLDEDGVIPGGIRMSLLDALFRR